jgi:hypothetical protein
MGFRGSGVQIPASRPGKSITYEVAERRESDLTEGAVNQFRRLTAFFLLSWLRRAYRKVMVIVLCPRSSCTCFKLAPFITRCDAKVCLRSWNLKSSIPARFTAALNPRYNIYSFRYASVISITVNQYLDKLEMPLYYNKVLISQF